MVEMTISLTKIEVSFSIHSTEDFEKNMEAVANLIPEDIIEQTEISVEELEGGYDNPIRYVSIIFKKVKEMDKILEYISTRLSNEQKMRLKDEFDERFHQKGKTFFLRIDKEEIFTNNLLVTSTENVIKIAIKMKSYTKDVDFKDFLRVKGIL